MESITAQPAWRERRVSCRTVDVRSQGPGLGRQNTIVGDPFKNADVFRSRTLKALMNVLMRLTVPTKSFAFNLF